MLTMQGLCDLLEFDVNVPITVVYNGSNLDSFLAAFLLWVERGKLNISSRDMDFFNVERGSVPPNIDGRQMLCLGYTYKKQTLNRLNTLHKILVIDNFVYDLTDHSTVDKSLGSQNTKLISNAKYDLSGQSSSMLMWKLLHKNEEPNPIVKYVQDRELFHFQLKDTREVIAALSSYSMDFAVWHGLFNSDINTLIKDGEIIRRYHMELNKYILKSVARTNFLEYSSIPIVNCPWFLISEVLTILAQNDLFAIGYYDKHKKRHVSLRSTLKSGVNVLNIAREYGGGGHVNAAGFTLDIQSEELFGPHFLCKGTKNVK